MSVKHLTHYVDEFATRQDALGKPATFHQGVAKVAGKKISGEFSVVSLFSGCGGMDMGFLGGFKFLGKDYDRLAYRIVWANDIKPSACKTYEANLKHKINCDDIWEVLSTLPKTADVALAVFHVKTCRSMAF